MTRKRSCNS